jgi:[ribosomal protein S5]-alanine N-acetyltransferase
MYTLQIIPQDCSLNNEVLVSQTVTELLENTKQFYQSVGFLPPWVGYLILKGDVVVGTCAFTGAPAEGMVEIAYWTFSDYEGKGVASYAAGALIDIANKENPSLIITAKTAPEHNASTKILSKHNFTFHSIVQDHEIGDAWLWTLNQY